MSFVVNIKCHQQSHYNHVAALDGQSEQPHLHLLFSEKVCWIIFNVPHSSLSNIVKNPEKGVH